MAKNALDLKIDAANRRNIFDCLYNKNVACDFNTDCEKCGWFPEEKDRRVEKFLRQNNHAVHTTRTSE